MKWLRVTALGLAVGLCVLAAAPAVYAEDVITPGRSMVLDEPGEWIAGWVARLAAWLGWGGEEPRATAEPAGGSGNGGTDLSGSPPPTGFGDCTGAMDPNGVPCRP